MAKIQTRIISIVLILVVLCGIGLRVWKLGYVPSGLFSDEIALALNGKLIAEQGKDEYGNVYPFGFESFSDYKLPGYIYAVAILERFLPSNEVTARLPAALASLALIFLIGAITGTLFPSHRGIVLISMAIAAFNPYLIHFGRIAYETMLSLALGLCAVFIFLKYPPPNHTRATVSAMGLAILSMWTYHAMRLILPVWIIIYFMSILFRTPKAERKFVLLPGLIVIIGLVIAFSPFIANPQIDSRPLSYFGVTGKNRISYTSRLMEMTGSYLRSYNLEYLFLKGDYWGYRHGTKEYGVFPFIFIIPYLVGWISLARMFINRKTRYSGFHLIFMLILFGMPSALTMVYPYGPRFLPMIVPLVLLTSLGTWECIKFLHSQKKLSYWVGLFILVIGLAYNILVYTHIFFVHFSNVSRDEFQAASMDLMEYVPQIENTGNKIYFLNELSCRPWGHDDMKLWYMRNLPGDVMTTWSKEYRVIRYGTGEPFPAYDYKKAPRIDTGKYVLFTSHKEMHDAPLGSYYVRCGIHLPDIDRSREKVLKVFYLFPKQNRDPIYVVSQRQEIEDVNKEWMDLD